MVASVGVLLAAYNGSSWIAEQIDSIIKQRDVSVTLFVSVDLSDDSTIDIVESYKRLYKNIEVLPYGKRFGSASANFYNLLQEVEVSGFDYIAFSDQDDVWEVDKLSRHVNLIKKQKSEAVSSDVIAFWPDKTQKLICKSQPQKKWDFIFESAGPGCSFLMTKWLVSKVKDRLQDSQSQAKDVEMHDWLVYAICRAYGRKWIIDSKPSVMYRQHESNLVGANAGIKAIYSRFLKIKSGWYLSEISKVCQVCKGITNENALNELSVLLQKRTFISKIHLLPFVAQGRRKFMDRIFLAFMILFF